MTLSKQIPGAGLAPETEAKQHRHLLQVILVFFSGRHGASRLRGGVFCIQGPLGRLGRCRAGAGGGGRACTLSSAQLRLVARAASWDMRPGCGAGPHLQRKGAAGWLQDQGEAGSPSPHPTQFRGENASSSRLQGGTTNVGSRQEREQRKTQSSHARLSAPSRPTMSARQRLPSEAVEA